jgi:hypothetical protein
MSAGFHKLFWGFLIVFVKIHILNVDILPDPLGYFLILQGIGILWKDSLGVEKARMLAGLLIVISIPSIFVQPNAAGFRMAMESTEWHLYGFALSIIKLVLVFHIFRMILNLVIRQGQSELQKRVEFTFNTYMAVMLTVTIAESFLMNLSGDWLIGLAIVMIGAALIMEIVFLVLLRALMKHPWGIVAA